MNPYLLYLNSTTVPFHAYLTKIQSSVLLQNDHPRPRRNLNLTYDNR